MIKLGDAESREIQAALLERRFPKVKAQLHDDEVLLFASERKPSRVTGFFCAAIGVFVAVQVSAHYIFLHPQWAIPVLAMSIACIWTGVWLALLVGNGFVFITDNRFVYWKTNFVGCHTREPLSVEYSEIAGIHLFRSSLAFGGKNNAAGDILIKKKKGGSYLVPSLKDSVGMSEVFMAELANYRARVAEEVPT